MMHMNPLISSEELKKVFVDFARKSESKLVIVLGAGASYGYSRNENFIYKPPTVSELLKAGSPLIQSIIEKPEHGVIKGQRAHIERSIRGFDGDLEAYLSDIYINDSEDNLFPSMLRYLEDIFTLVSQNADLDDNYYQGLMSTIKDLRGRKPWSILTFNYDTVLEQSIANLQRWIPGRTFSTDTEYLGSNPKLLKMHGGINTRYITVPSPEKSDSISPHEIFTEMMSNKKPTDTYLEYKQLDYPVPHTREYRTLKDIGGVTAYNFPLMMIPIHTEVKSENSFFCRQIEQAKDEVSQSGLVIAIGYQFGDNTFIEALKELDLTKSKLILVGTKILAKQGIDSRSFVSASKAWPKENIYIYDGDGFGEFTDSLYGI